MIVYKIIGTNDWRYISNVEEHIVKRLSHHNNIIVTEYAAYRNINASVCEVCFGIGSIPVEISIGGGSIPVDGELCENCNGNGWLY